jgi:FixJ family two-component response regulator
MNDTTDEPTVFIVDDEPDLRAALGLLIKSIGLKVEVFESAQQFWDAFDPARSGCLVLDVRMPGMSGLELQAKLGGIDYHLPIIMISGHGEIPTAVRAIKSGAVDFIQKPFSDQLLLDRVQQAIQLDREQRSAHRQRVEVKLRYDSLTPRERDVMREVVAGKINKVIASDLNVSTRTVEIHRARVMEKMAADSLSALMRMVTVLEDTGVKL